VLEAALREADIVVCLLTANFVASPFCMDKELAIALERSDRGECQILPIHVESFSASNESPVRQEFSQIELRMRGGEYDEPLRLMADLHTDFLSGWGHSAALIHWREQLSRKLPTSQAKVHNLSHLALALSEQEEHDRAIRVLGQALRTNQAAYNVADAAELNLQLAAEYFAEGDIEAALETYESVLLDEARRAGPAIIAAKAHVGASNCLAELGRFGSALEHDAAALAAVGPNSKGDGPLLHAEALHTTAINLSQTDDPSQAFERVQQARLLAVQLDNKVLEGQCLDVQAVIQLDRGSYQQAVQLALEAATVGSGTGSGRVTREANTTLAYAYLGLDKLDEASAAARAATASGGSPKPPVAATCRGSPRSALSPPGHIRTFSDHSLITVCG